MTSALESEIREQPQALRLLLESQAATAAALASVLQEEDVRVVVIVARGSSGNAARYAQYLLGRAHRVPVALATPSLYTVYGQPPRLDGAVVIAISQSGASPDVTAVVEEARRQGRPTIALTNNASSPVAQAATYVLLLKAGEERAVAATKTYLNSVAAIALLYAALSSDPRALVELERMPDAVEEQVELSLREVTSGNLGDFERGATVVARGVNHGTASEIALKIRELSGLLVEAYSAAEILHGPIGGLSAGWPVIAVAPPGPAQASVVETLSALKARGARTIAIAEEHEQVPDALTVLRLVRGIPEWLSPLTAAIPGQVAAMALAQARGLDIDHPAGLQKVTLTR